MRRVAAPRRTTGRSIAAVAVEIAIIIAEGSARIDACVAPVRCEEASGRVARVYSQTVNFSDTTWENYLYDSAQGYTRTVRVGPHGPNHDANRRTRGRLRAPRDG